MIEILENTKTTNEVFNIDCREGMKAYPNGFFDLALCDIPYGIGVTKMAYLKERATTIRQKNGNRLNPNRNKKYTADGNWDEQTPGQDYFDELKRVSKNQIIFGADYANWEGLGNGRIRWNKGFSEKVSFKKYETAYCSMVDDEIQIDLLWAGMCQAKSLKEPMIQQGNKKLNEKRIHPTQKPILLYMKLILDFGFAGCSIIDTHLGSGSSRIAADILGCCFVGFETDRGYFERQEKRYWQYKSKLKLF